MSIEDFFKFIKEQVGTYSVIYNGIEIGNFTDVILGNNKYHITSEFEMENTDPSNVLIAFHFYILANNKDIMFFDRCFQNIEINKKNVCLLLDYIEWYLRYRNNLVFILNYKCFLDKIENNFENYKDIFYVRNSLPRIKKLINDE
ncbi:hypothetical protein FACS189429_7430 [Bacteroidia bacterium]|nr:hypothetical protein FACS189429_7430 [Bacteroidia bacterium]